ncbi:NUDIX domain-containing protein [Devosia psychrophila]|nr:NUDIX domain-containing protein [Devosia psychrophila]
MAGKSDAEAALQEAREEAGIEGTVSDTPIGSYHFIKLLDDGTTKPSQAVIYSVRVLTQLNKWDEKDERRRKWFSLRKAAKAVFEPDLAKFLSNLASGRPALF